MESAGQYLSQPQQIRWGLDGLSGNFFLSAKHERQYRRIVGPVQQRIPGQPVGVECGERDQLFGVHGPAVVIQATILCTTSASIPL